MAYDDFTQQATKKLTEVINSCGFTLDEIDYKQNESDPFLTINGIDIGSVKGLSKFNPNRLLEFVRKRLIVEAVINHLGISPTNNNFAFVQQTPLAGTTGLWQIIINRDANDREVYRALVVEYMRDGQRVYEAF